MDRAIRCAAVVVLSTLFAGSALAAPPKPEELPPALRDWRAWVLHGDTDAACPFQHGAEARVCSWPGRLTLSLEDKGGRFTQAFRVYREAWLTLPGDARRWPQNVQVDGRPAIVAPGQGDPLNASVPHDRPTVKLPPGEHTVTGDFAWDALPEALDIPPDTGLLALSVKGKPIALPNRDASGRVFLQGGAQPGEVAERLDVTVHRLVTDEIPLTLVTRLTLNVSGKSREVLLGRALPFGFVPMSIASELPMRIEPDGHLRLQVRPGTWILSLTARHEGPVEKLARPEPGGPWGDGEEIWVFDARPSLRQVLVEGVNSLDPSQTTLPSEWKRFPAYTMGAKDVMQLTERRRGDADPAPDVLHLSRTLWLDFDGAGYTVSDKISGQLHRSWRLDMQPRTELGRVVAAGADQSITRLEAGKLAGVELRQGALALEADSRIVGDVGAIPAVSWDADFSSVHAVLQLPPGWRLMSLSGADDVPGTWFQKWDLWDIFLVVIIAAAMGRLFGWRWGALALVTLTLSWLEEDAPQYVWLSVLVGEALVRVLPANWVRTVLKVFRFAAWIALVLIAVYFSVQHVRQGMYPALAKERQLGGVMSYSAYSTENAAQYARSSNPPGPSGGEDVNQEVWEGKEDAVSGFIDRRAEAPPPQKAQPQQQIALGKSKQRSFNVRDYDKNAMVQTGPGLPRWEWTDVTLRFSGPVQRTQELSLWLVGPRTNFVLAFVRVFLLALMILVVLDFPGGFWPEALRRRAAAPRPSSAEPPQQKAARVAAVLGVLAALLAAPAYAQAVPSPETLEQLRQRLLEKPECVPTCASSPRMQLEATPTQLRLRLEVLAGAETAVQLPGNAQHWVPDAVVVDGRPAAALRRSADGSLWLALPEGAHQVLLEGALPSRDTVQVALPLKPHRVEAKLDGWSLDGLHEDGLADDNLQLSRKATNDKGQGAALQVGTLPPFVSVERTLVLGLTWTVETTVRRLTPTGSAVVLEVPLLAGESVTSSDVRVQGGKALVNMPAAATEFVWSSVLETKSPIALAAPKALPWVEVWTLDVSPVWHVQLSGIPVVHQQDASGAKLPEWRPWPGEEVKVDVLKPEGVAGQTLTIDQSSLVASPGVRATDVTFTANMRSSRGGLHTFTLPDDATLQGVTVNGAQQPIRQEGTKVSIPLVPGSQSVSLQWRQASGVLGSWSSPRLDLGAPTVNAELQVNVPQDRWVLFLSGPRMGPAVLFWSFLLVLLFVSVGLGRVPWTPLKAYHWVLLALGLSQVPVPAIGFVFAWLLFLGWRKKQPELGVAWFNLRQLAVVGATVVALIILGASVYEGLLGAPEMQIRGNGSYGSTLRWFQDRTTTTSPQAWVLSVPMLAYRGAMLAWSLWMAFAVLGWLKWGWQAFSAGGLWKAAPRVVKPPPLPKTPPPPPPPPPAT